MSYQGVNASLTHTSAKFTLGVEAVNPNDPTQTLLYVQADDALTAKNAATFDFAAGGSGSSANIPFLVTPTSAVAQEIVGIPLVAFAAGEYGWVVKRGPVTAVNVATGVAAGEVLVSTATAGRLDDHVSTATNPSEADHNALTQAVGGAIPVATSAESSNTANVYLQ
jgi:hypothetical protein